MLLRIWNKQQEYKTRIEREGAYNVLTSVVVGVLRSSKGQARSQQMQVP